MQRAVVGRAAQRLRKSGYGLCSQVTAMHDGSGDESDGKMADCDWQPREAMVLLYQQTETNVGHELYVCVQCFREEYPGQEQLSVVKPPPARRSGSVAGVTGACVCDGWGLNWLRVG